MVSFSELKNIKFLQEKRVSFVNSTLTYTCEVDNDYFMPFNLFWDDTRIGLTYGLKYGTDPYPEWAKMCEFGAPPENRLEMIKLVESKYYKNQEEQRQEELRREKEQLEWEKKRLQREKERLEKRTARLQEYGWA